MTTTFEVPPKLVDAILRGRCIAFVGAGFAMPVVPTWVKLLRALAEMIEQDITLADDAQAFELEAVGQLLQDRATRSGRQWGELVGAVLKDAGRAYPSDKLDARCHWLLSIPFKAILTTNFDASLTGTEIGPSAYWHILRSDRPAGSSRTDDLNDDWRRPSVVKLHGDTMSASQRLVFSRRDYRNLVHGDPRYASFIRAVFAGYTLLFMGVSFTDAYLNELRSEVLNLFHDPERGPLEPWGYAIQVGRSPQIIEFFAAHESIQTLPAKDPGEFDRWLQTIADTTSVEGRLRTLLQGKKIVWIDSTPTNNARGRDRFKRCGATIELLSSDTELTNSHAGADLQITKFGFDERGDHQALRVLRKLSGQSDRPPVVVFAAPVRPDDIEGQRKLADNRRVCLRAGAFEYATEWSELYNLIELLFDRIPGATRR